MKRIAALILCLVVFASLFAACTKKEEPETLSPQLSQMRSICDLAVMECYYHNVAKYFEKDASGFLFWKKDKHFWIEYSGIVELGIDATSLQLDITEDMVTITLPHAKVLSCTVDSSSLNSDSYIVDSNSADVTAKDEQKAFTEAQDNMLQAAKSNKALLNSAEQRVQELLTNYVENIGNTVGKTYTINWVFLDADQSDTTSQPGLSPTEIVSENP